MGLKHPGLDGRESEEEAEAGAEGQAGRAVAPDGLVSGVQDVVDAGEDLDLPAEVGGDDRVEKNISGQGRRRVGVDAEVAVEAPADPESVAGQVEAAEEADARFGRELVARPPQKLRAGPEVARRQTGVAQAETRAAAGPGLGRDLEAARPGPADVDVAGGEIEIDEIAERALEPGDLEDRPSCGQGLFDPGVPGDGPLGAEEGIADRTERGGRGKELVEGGRFEAAAEGRLEARPRRGDEIGRREAEGDGRAGPAVPVGPDAGGDEEAVLDLPMVEDIEAGRARPRRREGGLVRAI